MHITGIAAEFNPLHNGHEALIRSADGYKIAAISGCFTERGEPAIYDKYIRAKMALLAGADAVFELPVSFSVAGAERFASGMACMLSSLGADGMIFGSESGDAKALESTAKILLGEPDAFKDALREGLQKGLSFPAARLMALRAAGAPMLPATPNDILAIEYVKAKIKYSLGLDMKTVKRPGDYGSREIDPAAPSAKAVREAILRGKTDTVRKAVPEEVFALIADGKTKPVCAEDFSAALITLLRRSSPEEMKNLQDVTEGIENRILKAAQQAAGYGELMRLCAAKRYPLPRISRIVFSLLLKNEKSDIAAPPYARLLGFRRESAEVLAEIKKRASVPVIAKAADFRPEGGTLRMWETDLRAADIYAFAEGKPGGTDKSVSPIII